MATSKTRKDQPRWLKAKQRIVHGIASGEFAERLPPERELADRLGISYMTLRRAVGDLVEEGILQREVGRGTFVNPPSNFGSRTNCIGMVVADRVIDGSTNPFYSAVYQGALHETEANDCVLTFSHSSSKLLIPHKEEALGRVERKVDGLLMVALDEAGIRQAAKLTELVPVVLVDARSPSSGLPFVLPDNFNGQMEAIRHLIGLGHRRIAYIAGVAGNAASDERLRAYRACLDAAKIPIDERLIYTGDFWLMSGEEAADLFMGMREPPTAIACANDTMAIGLMKRLAALGYTVPNDVSVIGFDDIDSAQYLTPALSTVRIPRFELGRAACSLLFDLITNWEHKGVIRTDLSQTIPCELITRGSTAPPTRGRGPKR